MVWLGLVVGFLGFGALCEVDVIQVFWFVTLVVWVLRFWGFGFWCFGCLGCWGCVDWIHVAGFVFWFVLVSCLWRLVMLGLAFCGVALGWVWLGGLIFEVGWVRVGYYCFFWFVLVVIWLRLVFWVCGFI